PLLHIHWVPRYIDMDKSPCNLEVNSFSTRPRRNQVLRPVFSPKVLYFASSLSVRLSTDNHRRFSGTDRLQISRKSRHRLDGLGKEHYLFSCCGLKQSLFDQFPLLICRRLENFEPFVNETC